MAHVKDKAAFAKQCGFEELIRRPRVVCRLRVELLACRWRAGKRDVEACAEGRPLRDLGDRVRRSLDHPKSVSVDLAGPVLTKLLDELGGDAEPLWKVRR